MASVGDASWFYGLCKLGGWIQDEGGNAWSNAGGTGIYFWIAENGEAYVGQAKNVRRRLLQHWKVHRDILEAAFQPVDANDLDAVEADLIKRVGKAYPTRNIKLALETAAYVPFDQFMSASQRHSFLLGERQGCALDSRTLESWSRSRHNGSNGSNRNHVTTNY